MVASTSFYMSHDAKGGASEDQQNPDATVQKKRCCHYYRYISWDIMADTRVEDLQTNSYIFVVHDYPSLSGIEVCQNGPISFGAHGQTVDGCVLSSILHCNTLFNYDSDITSSLQTLPHNFVSALKKTFRLRLASSFHGRNAAHERSICRT